MAVVAFWNSASDFSPAGATLSGSPVVLTNNAMGMGDSLQIPAGTTASFIRFPLATAADAPVSVRYYFRTPSAWPSAANTILALRPVAASIAVGAAFSGTGSPGQFRIIGTGGATIGSTPSNTLQFDTTYRVDVTVTGTHPARTVSANLYVFGTAAPLWTLAPTTLAAGSAVATTLIDFGKINTTPDTLAYGIDSIRIDDTATPPPAHPADPALPPPEPDPDPTSITWEGVAGDATSFLGTKIALESGGRSASNSMFVVSQDVAESGYLSKVLSTAMPNVNVRGYFRIPDAWPSASFGLFTLRPDPSSFVVSATISGAGQPGQLRLVSQGGTNVAISPNNTLSVSTWYRVELQVRAGTGLARTAVFPIGSRIPIWSSGWQTHASFSGNTVHIQAGRVNASPLVPRLEMDDIRVDFTDTATWMGPQETNDSAPALPTFALKLWNGTALLPVVASVVASEGATPVGRESMYLWDGTTLNPFQP